MMVIIKMKMRMMVMKMNKDMIIMQSQVNTFKPPLFFAFHFYFIVMVTNANEYEGLDVEGEFGCWG